TRARRARTKAAPPPAHRLARGATVAAQWLARAHNRAGCRGADRSAPRAACPGLLRRCGRTRRRGWRRPRPAPPSELRRAAPRRARSRESRAGRETMAAQKLFGAQPLCAGTLQVRDRKGAVTTGNDDVVARQQHVTRIAPALDNPGATARDTLCG